MAVNMIVYPSVGERAARGNDARASTPPSSHAGWEPAADRPDPITLLEEQDLTREPDLVPVRHGLIRADADDGHLVRPPGRGRADEGGPRRAGRDRAGSEEGSETGQEAGKAAGEGGEEGREGSGEGPREGAHARQPAGAVQAG